MTHNATYPLSYITEGHLSVLMVSETVSEAACIELPFKSDQKHFQSLMTLPQNNHGFTTPSCLVAQFKVLRRDITSSSHQSTCEVNV